MTVMMMMMTFYYSLFFVILLNYIHVVDPIYNNIDYTRHSIYILNYNVIL